MTKNLVNNKILFLILLLFSFAIIFLPTNVCAFDDKIDIYLDEKNQPSAVEPLVLIQGEEITVGDIKNILFQDNLPLKNHVVSVSISLPEHTSSLGTASAIDKYTLNTNTIIIDTWRCLVENEHTEGSLKVIYAHPTVKDITVTINIPLIIKNNYKPEITVPHIYFSEEEYNSLTQDEINENILKQVSIYDPEGRTDLTAEIVGSYTLQPGETTTVNIRVEDYKNVITVPAYITTLSSQVSTNKSFENSTLITHSLKKTY